MLTEHYFVVQVSLFMLVVWNYKYTLLPSSMIAGSDLPINPRSCSDHSLDAGLPSGVRIQCTCSVYVCMYICIW